MTGDTRIQQVIDLTDRLKKSLNEHFDTVWIGVTFIIPDGDRDTAHVVGSTGNFYARDQTCRAFVLRSDERNRCGALDYEYNPENKGSERHKVLNEALDQFETATEAVQILTSYLDEDGVTRTLDMGVGNFLARVCSAREFYIKGEERVRKQVQSEKEEE